MKETVNEIANGKIVVASVIFAIVYWFLVFVISFIVCSLAV